MDASSRCRLVFFADQEKIMTISPDRWAEIKDLFDAVLEKNPAERPAFLGLRCPDPDLRMEVERLLSEHDQAGTFLSTPPVPDWARETVSELKLSENKVLAGRFRILRFIASGGMGDVYEAEDQELGEWVAIKTIRPEILVQPHAIQRFRREVHLARQVTHPNVCRIFDLFRHETSGDGKVPGIVFISMELLHGPHLATHLRKEGTLDCRDALPLIRQMVSALAAAHSVGIIHRDFKPQNVVLVPQAGQAHCRAVVTDFGLALRSETSSESLWVSTGAGLLGTPAYMSPEQIEGRTATAASDIYALGLVIYEMVTGERPFKGDTPMSAAVKRLTEAPIRPRNLNSSITPVWETTILRCLERDPHDRFASVEEVATALGSDQTKPSHSSNESSRLPFLQRKTQILTQIAALILVIAGIVYFRARGSNALTEKDSIVLADFTNKTTDTVLNDALKEGLAVELEQSPIINILAENKVSEQLQYMGRPADSVLTPDLAREVCLRAGSKAMLAGSVGQIGDHYVIGLKATVCQNGETIGNEQVEIDSRERVLAKLHEVGREMRIKLGESLTSVQKFDVPLAQATTSSLEALQAYSRANKALSLAGDSASVPLFQHAIELDPNFASAYADLAVVYANLNQFGLSATNAQKAYANRTRATEREKFLIDATYYRYATGELDKAARAYQEWKQTYPQDLTPYVNISLIDTTLGRLESALQNDQEGLKVARNGIIYTNLAYDYTSLNRLDEAAATLNEARKAGIKDSFLEISYQLGFLRDDVKEMQRCATESVGKPGEEDALLAIQADTEAFHGRLGVARSLSQQAINSALTSDAREVAAGWQAAAALREAEFGNSEEAEHDAFAALALASNPNLEISVALTLARAGNLVRAKSQLQRVAQQLRPNTIASAYWLPTIGAAIALREKQPKQALQDLESTTFYELGGAPPPFTAGATMYPTYLRGQAYLALGEWEKAIAEYKKIIDHQGLVWNSPLGTLSYLQLGRAYVGSGNPAARAIYDKFLSLWRDADPGLPLLREVRKEYSNLNKAG